MYLSNFAFLNVKDELARLKGVGDVAFLGPRDYSMRIWLDPNKLASLQMTAGDVIQGDQGAERPGGRRPHRSAPGPGRANVPFQLPITVQGRLTQEEQFEDIIVKRGEQGQIVRLRDVARKTQYDETGATDRKRGLSWAPRATT